MLAALIYQQLSSAYDRSSAPAMSELVRWHDSRWQLCLWSGGATLCTDQLSGAGDGNRTRIASLEVQYSTPTG